MIENTLSSQVVTLTEQETLIWGHVSDSSDKKN